MKRNYKQLFAICKAQGFDYKDKVAEISQGRTDSLKMLTDGEYKELMIRLVRLNEPTRKLAAKADFKPGDKMRKKMISLAAQMKWGEKMSDILTRLDKWCLDQKYKKPLMQHNEAELSLLVTIFEQRVYADYLKYLNV